MTDALFDVDQFREPAPVPAPPATTGQRRIARQRGVIAVGMHPLSLTVAPYLRLHPDAQREIGGAGPRCATCRYRVAVHGGSRGYPKCCWPDPDLSHRVRRNRISHGPATDIRRGWPACVDYEPKEAEAG